MDTKKLGIKFESNNRIIEVGKGKPFRLLNIDGIESSDFELFIEDNIFHDGSRVNHKRVKGRPIMIEAEYVGKHKEVERRKLASFFNVHRNGYLIINYQGIVRKIKYEVESFKAPLRNLYEPLKFLLHIYCPNPYWLEEEKEMDLVTWIPNLEFDAVEGFSTEQLENHWIETQIKKQGLKVFKNGTIFVELEEESTVPEVEIAYLLENGQYKRLKQQATVFSAGTGYDENGNYVDVSDSIVNGQINDIRIEGNTLITFLSKNQDDWEQGSISFSSGELIYATHRIRTKDFIKSIPGTQHDIRVASGYGIGVIQYFEDGTLAQGMDAWASNSYSFILKGSKFKVVLRKDGGGDISPSEIININPTMPTVVKSTISAIRLKSVGKNLLNIKNTYAKASGYIITDTGYIRPAGQTGEIRYILEVEKDAYYTVSRKILQGNSRITVIDFYTNEYLVSFNSSSTCTFKATSDKVILYFDTMSIRVNEITEVADIQVEKGTVATDYESYKESNAYVIAKDEEGNILELRSLPNGTKDEINVTDRKLIKRIGEKSNIANGMVIDFTDMAEGGTYFAWNDNGETETGNKGDILGIDAITLIYQLAEPIVKLLPPEPLTTFEEFESGIGVGEPIEFGYRLTKQIVEIENIGDVDAPIRVVFRAHGQVEKPYIQDVETREMIRINKTLQAGDVLEITTEFGNKNVYLNGEKAHHYLDFLNSTWLQLKPGINLIKYGAESGVDMLECRLYYTPRYLGV